MYWIKNKKGERVKFQFNKQQEKLYRSLWYLNIVLKARQQGVTTFACILFLDEILFSRNKTAAIIAHKLKDAQKIFKGKIKFAWDNLPDWLKAQYDVNTDTKDELVFSLKGTGGREPSSISVSTSVRSDTVQLLHISEFPFICRYYPEKAEEIVTGALNAVAAGQMIIIEGTAKGTDGYFYDYCVKAIQQAQAGAKLSPLDFKFHFSAWWESPEYVLDEPQVIDKEMLAYFASLEVELSLKLSQEQKWWYVAKRRHLVTNKGRSAEFMYSEYPATVSEAFMNTIEGAYYGKLMTQARVQRKIGKVPWVPTVPVDTYWDLGYGDSTFIWFIQSVAGQFRCIETYQNSGEGLQHYAKYLKDRPYIYGKHYGPHDINVHELGTGKTRIETMAGYGIRYQTDQSGENSAVPKLSLDDGHNACRAMIPMCWFDEVNAAQGIKALENYRHDWDDKHGVWKDEPFHDIHSHGADAFRTFGVTARVRFDYNLKPMEGSGSLGGVIVPDNLSEISSGGFRPV